MLSTLGSSEATVAFKSNPGLLGQVLSGAYVSISQITNRLYRIAFRFLIAATPLDYGSRTSAPTLQHCAGLLAWLFGLEHAVRYCVFTHGRTDLQLHRLYLDSKKEP